MKREVTNITVNYEIFGNDGPWVVLSHSLMCDLTMWGPQIDALKADYRVLAYDTRGHGGTDAQAVNTLLMSWRVMHTSC